MLPNIICMSYGRFVLLPMQFIMLQSLIALGQSIIDLPVFHYAESRRMLVSIIALLVRMCDILLLGK